MKKTLAFLLVILCLFTILSTNHKAYAIEDYYSSADGLIGDELLNELALISQEKHTKFNSYDDLREMNEISDRDPNNSSNILGFYSQISVKGKWDQGVTWNREHVWCRSLSGGLYEYKGAGADIHHLRPEISSINSSRGNKPFTDFDVIDQACEENRYNGILVAYTNNNYWEPLDIVKGDVARILMYVYMHYSNEITANKNYSYATGGTLSIQNVVYSKNGADGAWDILMDWNDLDPVDDFERNRHDYCVTKTGVRNPFIDNEDYARMIWDEDYTDGQERYNVTYHVEDDATFNYVDNIRYLDGKKVKEPTQTPYLDGYRFDGWYKEEECINKWDFSVDTISSNLDLYAKFSELTFKDILGDAEIKSQLVFDIIKEDNESQVISQQVVINTFIKGDGSIAKGDYDLSEFLDYDTSLFNMMYKHNKASSGSGYISASKKEIRLYPGGGNGSSIEITANDGLKIKEVKTSYTKIAPTITVSSDGKTAKIHNTTSATSGSENQSIIKSITVVYETLSKGYSYSIKEGSLAIKYNIILTETEYFKFILSDDELLLNLNNTSYEYDVYQYNNSYRIVCTIYVDEYNKVYSPTFKLDDIELKITGYSAKTLAQYYLNTLSKDDIVKEYKECLEKIIG